MIFFLKAGKKKDEQGVRWESKKKIQNICKGMDGADSKALFKIV